MSTFKFKLESSDSSVPLAFETWLDTQCLYFNNHVTDPSIVEIQLPDDEQSHQIRLILKNKQSDHTIIDLHGNIISDAFLSVTDMSFDDIKLSYNILQKLRYQHNFNNTGQDIEDKFYDRLGCNGTVFVDFTTPVLLWLLENM